MYQKIGYPQILDQSRGDKVSGPDQFDKTNTKQNSEINGVNYQPECLCSGQIWHDAEGCGNMPQSEHGLWEEKFPFVA